MLALCTPLKFEFVTYCSFGSRRIWVIILTDDVSLIRVEVEGWRRDEGDTDVDHPERRERKRGLRGVSSRHEL